MRGRRLRKILVGLSCLAALAAATPAFSQTLWQNLNVGMSPQQIMAAKPEAVRQDNPDHLASGAECQLKIQHFELLADDYSVCFFILDGKLAQVTLHHNGKPSKSDFDNVATALSAKYGRPYSEKPNALGYEADWVLDSGVNISMVLFDKYTPLLNINYQTRIAGEASKL